MVLNPKIIKVNTAIEKTKEQITELNAKLRDLEKQKTQLENDEIVAMFRREKLNEDEFAALLQSGRKKIAQTQQQPSSATIDLQVMPEKRKEDALNDSDEA